MIDPKDLVPGDQYYEEYNQKLFDDYIFNEHQYTEFSTRLLGKYRNEAKTNPAFDLDFLIQIEDVKQVDEYDKNIDRKKRKKETDETLNLIAGFFKNNPTIKKEQESLKKQELRRELTVEEKEIASHKKKLEKNKAKDTRLKNLIDSLSGENNSKNGVSTIDPLKNTSDKKKDDLHGDF